MGDLYFGVAQIDRADVIASSLNKLIREGPSALSLSCDDPRG
jgi:hypothetical protein